MTDHNEHALKSLGNIAAIIKSVVGPAAYRRWLCEQCHAEECYPRPKIAPFQRPLKNDTPPDHPRGPRAA